ncbi:MAG: class I SAM-dependent methyltransferase [Novosphingobium sp.]
MTRRADWQAEIGRNWAQSYAFTDRSFAGLTQQLLDRIDRLAGISVLDIGCGAGELSLALARQRHGAHIVGIDISSDLIAAARERAGERPQLSFEVADAASWRKPDFAPELLVSRHGVMFFDDPPGAFAHLHDIAAPGAELAFSCFRDRRLNPWMSELAALVPPDLAMPFDPHAPGPFAFSDPERVEEILGAGGWQAITFEPLDYAYITGYGDDPVADAIDFFGRIGPAAPAVRALTEGAERDAFIDRLKDWLEENRSGNTIAFPAAAWFVTARKE